MQNNPCYESRYTGAEIDEAVDAVYGIENAVETIRAVRESVSEAETTAEQAREVTEKATEIVNNYTEALDGKADRTELSNTLSEPTGAVLEDIEPLLTQQSVRTVPQALSEAERAQVLMNLGVETHETFIAEWEQAGGVYNRQTGFFELNGLTDITLKQAIPILRLYPLSFLQGPGPYSRRFAYLKQPRTLFPIAYYQTDGTSDNRADHLFYNYLSNNLEVIVLGYAQTWGGFSSMKGAFVGNPKLHTIRGLDCRYLKAEGMSGIFGGLAKLQNLYMTQLNASVSLADSPLITLESLEYAVTKRLNENVITITVHRDVYAKLTDEANSEWYAVRELAASKNISFATV